MKMPWTIIYGVELGADGVRFARRAGRGRSARETLAVMRSGESDARALEESAFPRVAVILGLEATACVLRTVSIPLRARRKARQVLPSLLDITLPFPLDQAVYVVVDWREEPDGTLSALTLVAQRDVLERRMEDWRAAGWDAVVVDGEATALADGFKATAGPKADGLLVHVETDRTVVLLMRGGWPEGMRTLRTEAQSDVVDAATFVRRLLQAASALTAQIALNRPVWVWSGAGVEDAERRQAWEALVKDAGWASFLTVDQPAFVAVRMLARRLAEGRAVDLRVGGREHPKVTVLRERLRLRAAWAALLAGLLLCGVNAFWVGLLRNRIDVAQAEIQAAARALTGLPTVPRGQELTVANRAIEEKQAALKPFRAAFDPDLGARLSVTVRAAWEAGVTLSRLGVSGGGLHARGSAESWEACEAFSRALEKQWGMPARLTRADAGADERVPFTIDVGWGDA